RRMRRRRRVDPVRGGALEALAEGVEHRAQQRFLVGKVVEDGRLGEPGALGDDGEADTGISAVGVQTARFVDQPRAQQRRLTGSGRATGPAARCRGLLLAAAHAAAAAGGCPYVTGQYGVGTKARRRTRSGMTSSE